MGFPYAFVKVFAGEGDGHIEGTRGLDAKASIDYLMQSEKMKGEFLGACLDSCRIGSMTTCRWPTDIYGFMNLITKWREENDDDPALYHEKSIDEVWKKFELPRINHDYCPRDGKHLGTFLDVGGRIRCAHRTTKSVKPSFVVLYGPYWGSHSQMNYFEYGDDVPTDPSYVDDEGDLVLTDEYDDYLRKKAQYDVEGQENVIDVCYSVIKDSDSPLAFETVLRRLNILPEKKTVYCGGNGLSECERLDELSQKDRDWWKGLNWCHGHSDKLNAVEFTFDGWEVAHYVAKWRGQGNDAPWFAKEIERWPARENLRICSND